MSLFHGKALDSIPFDPSKEEAAVKKSILTGEATAGFLDRATGHFRDVQVIKTPMDLQEFCQRTETDPGTIRTIY